MNAESSLFVAVLALAFIAAGLTIAFIGKANGATTIKALGAWIIAVIQAVRGTLAPKPAPLPVPGPPRKSRRRHRVTGAMRRTIEPPPPVS